MIFKLNSFDCLFKRGNISGLMELIISIETFHAEKIKVSG